MKGNSGKSYEGGKDTMKGNSGKSYGGGKDTNHSDTRPAHHKNKIHKKDNRVMIQYQ